MENKDMRNPEEAGFSPEELPESFPDLVPELEEEMPLIQELSMEAPAPETEVLPEETIPDAPVLPDEITLPEEDTTPADLPSEEVESVLPEESAAEPESIPEDPPAHDLLTEPDDVAEILPDDHAMDAHGMLEHGEEEPPFDLSILNDPALAEPAAEESKEEVLDQEYRDNASGREFEEMHSASAADVEIPNHPRPTRKGRPKRKKGAGLFGIPHILVTFVWLALIVAIGVTLGRMLWICAADVLAFGREDKVVTVTIYESDTIEEITEKLCDAGLIRYKSLFGIYADLAVDDGDIHPGIYDLNTRYDYHALVNAMSPRSSREVVEGLLIPEGYTCKQIFELLEEYRICTAKDIAAYAASGELDDYWFLENVQRGSGYCLEGFLFPDTYDFYKNSTPREVLEKLLDNFEVKFTEEMRSQIDTLNANITGGEFTVREVAIVASLIEKETASSEESPKIAGVIYNRLYNWDYPALLNIDAAIIYAQDGNADRIDTSLDSPYNTYLNVGLTPTPIANPGLSSIQAALNPEMHEYYYYVLNPATGRHQFSTTLDEHQGYVSQFAAAAEG